MMFNPFRKFLAHTDGHMQEAVKKASLALSIRVLGTLLGFAVSVLVARLLGAEGSGVYFLALSVATIAATVGRIGFDNTVVRFIASHASVNEWNSVRFVYRAAIKVVALASLLVSIALFLGAGWIASALFDKPFMELPFRLVAVAVLPLSLAMIQAESLRGLKRIPASQWIKTVFMSLGSLVLLYPLVQLWGANGAVASHAVAVFVAALAAWLLWQKTWRKTAKPASDMRSTLSLKPLFQSSWPLFGVALTALVMQQAATIFLGIWGTAEEVGIFSIANRVANLLLFPLMAMISILAPKFAAMHRQGDLDGLKRLVRSSSRMLTLFAVPMAIAVAISAEWILTIFGAEFKDGVIVLDILLIGVVMNAATGAVAELLMMSGFEKSVSRVVAISSLITVAIAMIMIPKYGLIGAAIATSIGMSTQNLLMVVVVKTRMDFWPISLILQNNRN